MWNPLLTANYTWNPDTFGMKILGISFMPFLSLASVLHFSLSIHKERRKQEKKIARFRVGHYIGNIFTNNIAWNCKIYAGKKHWNQFQTICFRDILLKNTTISVIFDHNLESFRMETSSSSVDQMEKQLFLSNLKM